MTLVMIDDNGHGMPLLAPRSGGDVTLDADGAVVLASSDRHRAVSLLADSGDVYFGVGTEANYIKRLVAGADYAVKLEAGFNLYAKGSGTINVVVMG